MDEPDFAITVKIGKVKAVIGVLASTTVGKMKKWIEKGMNMKRKSYYLVYNDGKKKHKLEDHYKMEDYGITEDKEFQFVPKLGGAGKRGRGDGAAGGAAGCLSERRNAFGRTHRRYDFAVVDGGAE